MNGWKGYISLSLVMLFFAIAILFSDGLLPVIKILGISVFITLSIISMIAAFRLNEKTEIEQLFDIEEGSHQSKPLVFRITNANEFRITWKFSRKPLQSERYTNKIAGFGYFPHHLYNSWRLGYEIIDDQITYCIYTRERGEFKITPLPQLRGYKGTINISVKSNYLIATWHNGDKLQSMIVFYRRTSNLGYFLKPHHGGKESSLIDYSVFVKTTWI